MPQRRLLASTLAGLLAMVGFPSLGPSTAVHALSEQGCEDTDCVAEDQVGADESDSLEWDADAEAQSEDEFVDESAPEEVDQSFVAEQEPEADVAQADEEEEESADSDDNEVSATDETPAADSPLDEVAAEPEPAATPDPPTPTVTPTPPVQAAPAPVSAAPASAVRTQIRAYIAAEIKEQTFADSDDIFSMGFVNSLFAMKLVSYCEKSFAIEVNDEDLDVGNFRSVDNLVAFVERKQGR